MDYESIGQKMGISTRLLERKILRGIKRREYHLPCRQVMHRRAKRSHNYGVLQCRPPPLLPRPVAVATHSLMRMRPEEFHFSVFNYAKLILASHARQTDSFCMSCIYVHNDAFHCRQGGFARAGAYKHHRQSGRGFVTIGDKTSAKARSLRLCFGNYLYFPTSLPTLFSFLEAGAYILYFSRKSKGHLEVENTV